MSKILSLKPEFDVIFKNEDTSKNEKLTAILDNSIAYYTSKNRCYHDATGCLYSPENSRGSLTYKDTEGCAVGRLLTNESANILDNLSDTMGSIDNLIKLNETNDLQYKFPELMTTYTQFFILLQRLHDVEINWEEKGLSSHGENRVKEIRDYINSI